MATKKKGQTDASTFEGNGISFKAKLIGIEEVAEARGDLLCQEAITRLKNAVRATGQHKQKIFVNVTLEGLKIIDAIALQTANQNKKKSDTRNSKTSVDSEEAVKTDDMVVLHTHPVHRISFISRDTTDNRAFGYIIGSGDGKHTFFAIKTASAAEQLVLTLRDLFQVVYEMKKKEVDEAKVKLEESNTTEDTKDTENEKPSREGSTSEGAQTQATQAADGDGIYHDIEQIKNLEFDAITSDGDSVPMSPPPVNGTTGTADPWAVPAATTAANSSLGDLAGIQTGPTAFVNMPQQPQPFPGGAFPGQMPGYNPAAVPGFNMTNAGLPVSRDPFGTDPFSAAYRQPGVQPGVNPAGFAAPAFGPPVANPFGGPGFGQQYQGVARSPVPGAVPPGGMFPPPAANPFANFNNPQPPQEDPNLLKPFRSDQQGQEAGQDPEMARSKSPKEDLFGDLLGITKSTSAAKTPKDMFAQLSSAEKKTMNELKNNTEMPPKASFDNMDPFMDNGNMSEDKTRGLIHSEGGDPFDTSHIPSLSVPHVSTIPPSSSTSVPPVPQRLVKDSISQKSSSKPSSPSSCSSSSPHISSKQTPLLAPPPPPIRSKTNPSSTISPSLSLSNKDTDVSNHFDPFILPSPDEPPPPLPQDYIKSPAAPPPPPRPSSSKSLSSMSSNTQRSADNSPSLFSTNQFQSSSQTNNSSLSTSVSLTNPIDKPNTLASKPKDSHNALKFDVTFSDAISNDPFSIPLKSSEVCKNKHNDNNNVPDKFTHFDTTHTPKHNSSKHSSSDSSATKSVISNPSPKAEISSEGTETDPFGLPLHPTPGFKAVARFGSDPFEDSFGANTNNPEQDLAKWDPFSDTTSPFDISPAKVSSTDPWNTNSSPFGDAFAPQQ